ncbi:hypothetical protein ABC255_16985 [Neobacillus sp. 3P2-tot-E-2]|uniref:hypothetical protein n=1 Tax=Neobacillus sp. 3P2-tot-E-2 TaxID=3132212 RepID=UPI0039A22463
MIFEGVFCILGKYSIEFIYIAHDESQYNQSLYRCNVIPTLELTKNENYGNSKFKKEPQAPTSYWMVPVALLFSTL